MKIENTMKSLGGVKPAETRSRTATSGSTPSAAGADKVELSSLSSSLAHAEAAMASTPVVDKARVEAIRQAISEGRFTIDPSRIADGLIDSVREMLSNQTST